VEEFIAQNIYPIKSLIKCDLMKKKTTLLLFILILSIYTLNINVQSSIEENDYQPASLELTPHDSISILNDSAFSSYGFPGSGTEEDPYVIEGYNIITTDFYGIYITDTTKYFTVRNCYVDAEFSGIYISNVAGFTATVINNTCNNNNIGILLRYSGRFTINNNTCNNNDNFGIGLYISDYCVVTYNLLQENKGYGVYSSYGSDINIIHHNNFVDNNLEGTSHTGTSQAYDDGGNNYWYDTATLEGNYWSDWSGTGNYSIDGYTDSVDLYPLDEPAEYITIVSTTDETPLNFTFTLLLLVVPLILTKTISKKTKKK